MALKKALAEASALVAKRPQEATWNPEAARGYGPSVEANGPLQAIAQNLAARLPQPSQPLPLGPAGVQFTNDKRPGVKTAGAKQVGVATRNLHRILEHCAMLASRCWMITCG